MRRASDFLDEKDALATINHFSYNSSAYLIACSSGLSLGLFIPVSKAVECTWYFVAVCRYDATVRDFCQYCQRY